VYIPQSFRIEEKKELFDFCEAHSFGTVITNSSKGAPEITHVPFVLKEKTESEIFVEFHLAKDNFQSRQFEINAVCGLLVSGAHGYISSSVYEKENVPTYNYESVYLTCESSVLNPSELEIHLEELVTQFEKGRTPELKYEGFSRSMIDSYLPEIIGVRLKVLKMEGAFKLSQNRSEKDLHSIIADNSHNPELCAAMKKHYKND